MQQIQQIFLIFIRYGKKIIPVYIYMECRKKLLFLL